MQESPWKFCVAPMIAVTDRHCRYFFRLISPNSRLYTEMITCPAIIHGDQDYLLGFNPAEQALAIQLGGSDPEQFRKCINPIEERYYQEININVGCPSDRVQSGRFGACLMKEPELLKDCFLALKENTSLPVTIKCRIGVDEFDSDEFFLNFIESLAQAGCNTFIVHARIALLKGLSPKENRNIPPLNFERVSSMKKSYPDLNIIVNGGITSISETLDHLENFEGVMMGREIYKNPYLLNAVEASIFKAPSEITRAQIIERVAPYLENEMNKGLSPHSITRHLYGLFHGKKLGRKWRQVISSNPIKHKDDIKSLLELAQHIDKQNSLEFQESIYA